MTYIPDEAAPLVGVAASTIRNWCKTFANELSPGANPPSGNERRLTQEDVAKLQRVKAWRDNRLPPQEITRLLQAAATADDLTHIVIDATPTAQEGQGEALLLPAVISDIQTRLQALERDRVVQARQLSHKAVRYARLEGAAVALMAGGFVMYLWWLLMGIGS
jgi:DNA-binding transcriptional MerR regulator